MQTDMDPFRCPAEDAIEFWAIQDVLGTPDDDERLHLINCPLCHELHLRFLHFYDTVHQEAHRYLVARQTGATYSISTHQERVRSEFQILRPVDQLDGATGRTRPIAVSRLLLSGLGKGRQVEDTFISTDGTVIGKFLRLAGEPDRSFQLLSPDTRYVKRSLLHLKDDRSFFQSSDYGTGAVPSLARSPSGIPSIEVVPHIAEALFDPVRLSRDNDLIPGLVKIDGGPAGGMILEQEEGDRGESILHLVLSGMPEPFFTKRVIAALVTGYSAPMIEEAIGRDLYFYGVDLFRSFRLWVYLR